MGKIGEIEILRWLKDKNILTESQFTGFKNEALSIYYGETNVDRFDLKIKNISIDIKTALEPTHSYLIVPMDQWKNQQKDIYIGGRIYYEKAKQTEILQTIEHLKCASMIEFIQDSIPQKLALKIKTWGIKVEICGFLSRKSIKWEKIQGSALQDDAICPEKECVRVRLDQLENIDTLPAYLHKISNPF